MSGRSSSILLSSSIRGWGKLREASLRRIRPSLAVRGEQVRTFVSKSTKDDHVAGAWSPSAAIDHSPPPPAIAKAEESLKNASLVIFDKDGTLICFHSMWVPWALSTAERIEEASNLKESEIAKEVYRLLGFCPIEKKVRPGLLAEATMGEIRERLVHLLVEHGLESDKAIQVVDECVQDCDTTSSNTLKQIGNLKHMFEELKAHNVKIAVCTADSRRGTLGALRGLGLEQYIDIIVCGDDAGTQPKPSPHNALAICKAMGVEPADAFMVGDTLADMGMGRSAKLGGTIGVLSGVAKEMELSPMADHVVVDVGEVLPILLKRRNPAGGAVRLS
uniref:Uncharacterized protein n=1 Tax=Plectus sambesii TaxID=2011161 RepID=A0A914VFE7_9BILA